MADETKQLTEELQGAFASFKEIHERLEGEVKTLGDGSAETKQTIDQIQSKLDEVEARLEKAALDTKRDAGEPSEERKAFLSYLRSKSDDSIEPDERKLLKIGDDTGAGFLAPDEFVAELIKGETEFSPLRELARVRQTTRSSVKAPKRTGTASAAWIKETGARSDTGDPSYGLEEIGTHELYAYARATFADLEDSAFDVEEILLDEFSEQFGVAEGTALVSGNGVGKPEGFLEHPDVGSVTSTVNDVLDEDDFAKLLYALKEPYHANATWLMHRTTVRDARLLKDANGQYLWQPALSDGTPSTILGRPYRMAADMPEVANAAKAVAVGDWRRAYWIVDRIQIAVQRDPYTEAKNGAVVFHARKRVGGQVVVAEAVKYLTIQ